MAMGNMQKMVTFGFVVFELCKWTDRQTHTTILRLSWILSGTTQVSRTRKVQETQLKLAVADRTKPEVEIWRRPKK